MSNITKQKLQAIIREELSTFNENVDHAGIRDIVNHSSKLLAAVESFREAAAPAVVNAVTPGLDQLAATLEDMVSNPGSYVMKVKSEPVVRKFKQVKAEGATIKEEIRRPTSEMFSLLRGYFSRPSADNAPAALKAVRSLRLSKLLSKAEAADLREAISGGRGSSGMLTMLKVADSRRHRKGFWIQD
jgi:hypothetical protein